METVGNNASHMLGLAGLICLLACVDGCAMVGRRAAPLHGEASFKVFIPPGAPAFDLPSNQKIVLGEPLTQAKPIYPQGLLGEKIPVATVCLTLAIDASGAVYMVRPLYDMPGCPPSAGAIDQAFVAAARSATARWRFQPARLCTFQPGVNAYAHGDNCGAEGATVKPIAISLAFVFVFSQTNGRGNVDLRSFAPVR